MLDPTAAAGTAKQGVRINAQATAEAFGLLRHHPLIKTCRNIVLKYIMSHGLVFRQGDTDQTARDIEWYYERFLESAVDWILAVGLVPMTFVQIMDHWIPQVLPPESGYLTTQYSPYVQTFQWTTTAGGAGGGGNSSLPDTRVPVLAGFGYDPTLTGELTSLVSSLLPEYHAVEELLHWSRVAQKTQADPCLVLQMRPDPKHRAPIMGVDYGYYAEDDVVESNTSIQWKRNEEAQQQLAHMNQWIESQYYDSPFTSQRIAYSNQYRVPQQWEVAQGPRAESPVHLDAALRRFEDTILHVFGIPRSVLSTEGERYGNDRGKLHQFKETIHHWKKHMAHLLTYAYSRAYRGNPWGPSEDEEPQDLQTRTSPNDAAQAHVVLPSLQLIPFEEWLAYRESGVISHDEFIHCVRTSAGLPAPIKSTDPSPTAPLAPKDEQRHAPAEGKGHASNGGRLPLDMSAVRA